MRKLIPCLVAVLLPWLAVIDVGAQAKKKAMTNQDVIKMVEVGLGEELIIASIQHASLCQFDLSADGLIALKQAEVPEAIIGAMLDPGKPTLTSSSTSAERASPSTSKGKVASKPAASAKIANRDPGIYVEIDGHTVQLEPTVYSGGKTGNKFVSAMTAGIKKANIKAVVRGPRANLRFNQSLPTFYFYFEDKTPGLSNTTGFDSFFAGATSPNEFILARMTAKPNERELIVAEVGTFSERVGTRGQDTVDMKIEKLEPGVYRVVPGYSLAPGEYCFFYAGSMGVGAMASGVYGAGAMGRLFDFGVDR